MQRTWRPSRLGAQAVFLAMWSTGLLAACSETSVHVPGPGAVPIPTLQTVPDDLSRSPQLAALVPRDTAGLQLDQPSAAAGLLPDALAALAASPDAPTELSRLSVYGDAVHLTYEERGINGRSVSAVYRPDDGIHFGTPSFNEATTFPIATVDDEIAAELVAAVEQQVPNGKVTSLDLDVSLSYGFGLVWRIDVADARGSLATVFADLDGAIVGVDLS